MSKPANPPLFEWAWFHDNKDDPGERRAVTDITLRDVFAGMAMQAIRSDDKMMRTFSESRRSEPRGEPIRDQVAALAYGYADALLRAREETA
jgi:hypothetical protein